jgi:hypothetical protein
MADDTRDDDELWLHALSGRATGDSPTTREAHELRAAILARQIPDIAVAEQDPAREQLLLARARQAGLLDTPRHPLQRYRMSLAAAVVACLGLALWSLQQHPDEGFIVRSATDGIIRVDAADPRRLKQQMLADLRSAGITANGYEHLGSEGIDAELPPVLTPAMANVLERYDLPAPADGVLRMEIAAHADDR